MQNEKRTFPGKAASVHRSGIENPEARISRIHEEQGAILLRFSPRKFWMMSGAYKGKFLLRHFIARFGFGSGEVRSRSDPGRLADDGLDDIILTNRNRKRQDVQQETEYQFEEFKVRLDVARARWQGP